MKCHFCPDHMTDGIQFQLSSNKYAWSCYACVRVALVAKAKKSIESPKDDYLYDIGL